MSTKMKVLIGFLLYFGITIVLFLVFGSDGKNEEFQPQNEFLLEPWVNLDLGFADLSINKAVLYIVLASGAHDRRDAVHRQPHAARSRTRCRWRSSSPTTSPATTSPAATSPTRSSPRSGSRSWPTLFFFIRFSNIIGLIPLPTNTEHPIDIFGLEVPALRALRGDREHLDPAGADADRLVGAYHYRGRPRARASFGYLKSWLPAGLEDMNAFGKALDLHDRGDLALRPR